MLPTSNLLTKATNNQIKKVSIEVTKSRFFTTTLNYALQENINLPVKLY